MKLKYVAIFLVLLCCLMGAASAAEDTSLDTVGTAIDDSISVDSVPDDISDSVTTEPAVSDDSTIEEINEDAQTVENGEDSADADSEPSRAMNTNAANWSQLKDACNSGSNQVIDLTGTEYIIGDAITFGNSATIRGTSNSYITGNSTTIPFVNSNTSNSITFYNVNFRNINCLMLIQLQTNGISKLIDCTFTNITTGNDHHSVVYNNKGTMNITGCTFTNCTTGYGVVSNYRYGTTTGVTLNVKDSKFENNYALYEPGAINNCGILDVYNCTFLNNSAEWWAGAIHTHSDASTVINQSTFKHNLAGWNGGALFTYSVLEVYNSLFEDNNCTTDTGGGAIGSYNYESNYDILIENCTFKNNNNLDTNGHGGAITSLNGGYLNVYDSTFISNSATVGQAICAYNQNIENGTNDKPYLAVEDCTFINHTGTNDTVYVDGYINSFSGNTFINSPQTHYPGSGNTYNSIASPLQIKSNQLLASSSEDILGDTRPHDTIYVNSSSSNDASVTRKTKPGYCEGQSWDDAYGLSTGFFWAFQNINYDGNIIIADGEYIFDTAFDDWRARLMSRSCTITGFGDNVRFVFPDSYNIDFGSEEGYYQQTSIGVDENNQEIKISTPEMTITHVNIIFDCDVKVGSKNFKFINCTFNKGLTLSHDYESDDVLEMTFENCTFANPKADIAISDKVTASFDDDCTFPITAIDSLIDISSTEKGVVVITLTDNSTNPIDGATVKYSINGGENQTAITIDGGKVTIPGLTGEVTIDVFYEGNESFNGVTGNQFFNFTEEPEPANDTNGSNSTPATPAKVATKLAASKVTATYNVAKKLVITLTDKNGKKLANKKVTVKVGSISKTLKTDKNGKVSLNIASLVPKTYTATVKFAGDSSYAASTVKPKVVVNKAKVKLAAKAKTFKVKVKTKKLTATLKDNKGKVMKNTKLTLKVGKKTYTAKTNKKGVATFKITKLNKKGKYTATIKFAANKYFKALSKKVKITVKK